LRKQAADLERDLSQGIVGATGNVTEHLVTRQREARAFLRDIQDEITRLDTLTDDQVRQWAADHDGQ
jgi:hypothetical protein